MSRCALEKSPWCYVCQLWQVSPRRDVTRHHQRQGPAALRVENWVMGFQGSGFRVQGSGFRVQ
eukprot:2383980-Rhodomonas_salina.1